MKGGLPTISFRDITIQRRENDLVAASFGRGFYVLDDITPIREMSSSMLSNEATLFPVKDAYWYVQIDEVYGQGNNEYSAENPPYGAVFTYYMSESLKSIEDTRKEKEKELTKSNSNIPFPGWDKLDEEKRQPKPQILLTIKDSNGEVVNTIEGKNAKGINRVSWDLTYASRSGERLSGPSGGGGWFGGGVQATPGTYTVTLSKLVDGQMTDLSEPVEFKVVRMEEGALKGAGYDEINSFREDFVAFQQKSTETNLMLDKANKTYEAMMRAIKKAKNPTKELYSKLYSLKTKLDEIDLQMNGNSAKSEIGEKTKPSPGNGNLYGIIALSGTYGPTQNHKDAFNVSVKMLDEVHGNLETVINEDIPALRKELETAGAPWVEEM